MSPSKYQLLMGILSMVATGARLRRLSSSRGGGLAFAFAPPVISKQHRLSTNRRCQYPDPTPSSVSLASKWDDFMNDIDGLVSSPQTEGGGEAATNDQENPTRLATSKGQPKGWCTVDPKALCELLKDEAIFNTTAAVPSPVEERMIQGRRVYVKRDDLLRLSGSSISGNKARKMWVLNQLNATEFPSCVVSYGGPQSNSMLALAAVINYKNRQILSSAEADSDDKPQMIRFVYYTKKLPRFLQKQSSGNLFRATSLGMELHEVSQEDYQNWFGNEWGGTASPPLGLPPPSSSSTSLWIPQGGAFIMAQQGAKMLGQEIWDFWYTKNQQEGGDDVGRRLSVVIPGGTCTTAVLVHHALKTLQSKSTNVDSRLDIEVVVVPCVGDAMYAQRQMKQLSAQVGADPDDIPHILSPAPQQQQVTGDTSPSPSDHHYFPFAEPHKALLDTFERLKNDYDLLVDLIYGAPSWTIMRRHWSTTLSADLDFDPRNPLAGREIMYVHSGGLEGINSQLLRYSYKGLVDLDDVQLPYSQKFAPGSQMAEDAQ